MPAAPEPAHAALTGVMRLDRGRILSALIARLRNFQLAEDALQDAATSALTHWHRAGVPANPTAWLIRVAFRKAIDRLRQARRNGEHTAAMAVLTGDEVDETDPDMIPDKRLALIFTCCHPALDPKSRVALTLRTLGGLTTPEIARAFLDTDTTMGARLTRAKAKIAAAGIPFAVPGPEDWPDRLNSVLTVIYLIFNAGYTLGPSADRDLCAEAIYLARLLNHLQPKEPEAEGCLALMLITQSRHKARTDGRGVTIALTEQDRSLWDRGMIAEGLALIDQAISRRAVGPFQIKAAIAACHVQDHGPDWSQITALYESLLGYEPTDIIRLNHAVALAETGDLIAALSQVETLAAALDAYQPYHAANAELLARAGRIQESLAAYALALSMAASASDATFLAERRQKLLQ